MFMFLEWSYLFFFVRFVRYRCKIRVFIIKRDDYGDGWNIELYNFR